MNDEIDSQIAHCLETTAQSLAASFQHYWPADEHDKNDPKEQNVAFHLAHVFLDQGFSVFAEANHPNQSGRRIDLLAIASTGDWFLASEFKRILCNKPGESLGEVLHDLERLEDFWLNTRLKEESVGQHQTDVVQRCERGVGLVCGLLWTPPLPNRSSLLQFWENQGTDGQSDAYQRLQRKLLDLHATWPKPIRAWTTATGGAYYLLAAYFEIKRHS